MTPAENADSVPVGTFRQMREAFRRLEAAGRLPQLIDTMRARRAAAKGNAVKHRLSRADRDGGVR